MDKLSVDIKLSKQGFLLSVTQNIDTQGISVIWGPSGSGKSLFLRSIAGFENAEGKIVNKQETLLDSQSNIDIKPYLRKIGYVAQESNLFPHLNVEQNLKFAYQRANQRLKNKHYDYQQVIKALNLEPLLQQSSISLSGGEKQRCAIAQSLLSYPELLLMDEPLSALDGERKQVILELIAEIPTKFHIPILYVTHSYEELLKLADNVLLIAKGKAEGYYSIDDFFAQNTNNSLIPTHQLCSLLKGTSSDKSSFNLSQIECSGQTLHIPKAVDHSRNIQLVIYAKDVSISLVKPVQSSILNLLDAEIVSIVDYSPASSLVTLKIGEQLLASLITKKSLAELGLETGQNVVAQIKTISFIR
ncbi:MAG: molybdenum ABC transporter ATP-binding protein [Kangiellaceae bacterium]|nr:molybdenum ABC transporter ATP-binding protein [Kangiellaceae bacterium]